VLQALAALFKQQYRLLELVVSIDLTGKLVICLDMLI
jgi:hypothetical protein